MSDFTDIIWPVLDNWTLAELAAQKESLHADIKSIEQASWDPKVAVMILEEARRIVDDEESRRVTADSRASTYLAVCVGLVPLLTYISATILDLAAKEATSGAPDISTALSELRVWVCLVLLCLAVAYLFRAGVWSLKVLFVREFHRVDANDIVKMKGATIDVSSVLIGQVLLAARRNRDPVNDKMSAIKMAHEFLKRALLSSCAVFFLLVAFELLMRIPWSDFGC